MEDLIAKNWATRTRALVEAHEGMWDPGICIQGGGAKGAWEAGVLSAILENPPTTNPSEVFGTSAGALNAMWASTLRQDTDTRRLLYNWTYVGTIISATVIFAPACAFSLLFAAIIYAKYPSVEVVVAASVYAFTIWALFMVVMLEAFSGLGVIVAAASSCLVVAVPLVASGQQWLGTVAILLICVFGVPTVLAGVWCLPWQIFGRRIPGLLPITWVSALLPRPEGRPRFQVFMCTADVSLRKIPEKWSWKTLGVFRLSPNEAEARLVTRPGNVPHDLRKAAMCSAALPIVCQPYAFGESRFLDGGMEANLPAGHIFERWPIGARCLICIVPQPVESLDRNEHVQYRTLKFLHDLTKEQAFHRRAPAIRPDRSGSQHPANTMYPILLVSPAERLESDVITGFLRPNLLEPEFQSGRKVSQSLVQALKAFYEDKDDHALDPYLLDHKQLPALSGDVPKPGLWALWANPNWLN